MTDAGDDDTGALTLRLSHHDFSHDSGILCVEVTDRLVGQQEVERLAECTDERHALLLSVAQLSESGVALVGDAQGFKPSIDLRFSLELRELVLDLYVLHRCQLREDTELLEHRAQRALAQHRPIVGAQFTDITTVKAHSAFIVTAIADKIAAQ